MVKVVHPTGLGLIVGEEMERMHGVEVREGDLLSADKGLEMMIICLSGLLMILLKEEHLIMMENLELTN